MRSLQLSDLRETVEKRSGSTRDLVGQFQGMQAERADEGGRERPTYRSFDVGWIDIGIGVLSLVLAIMAWQRDRAKSRQELLDGAVFVMLGVLERYVDAKQRPKQ